MMRRALVSVVGSLFMSGCIAAAPAHKPRGEPALSGPLASPRVVPLRNPGFENAPRSGERCPEHWGCTMHSDPDSFRFALELAAPAEGRQSLCIERVRDEPWSLATQEVDARPLRGARLRFSLAVRIDRAEGAGAGPYLVVSGPTGNLLHEERLLTRTEGWQRVGIDFAVAPTAQTFEIGATLQGGGRVCVDDARLEFRDPEKK
jgi:hypothetical protein